MAYLYLAKRGITTCDAPNQDRAQIRMIVIVRMSNEFREWLEFRNRGHQPLAREDGEILFSAVGWFLKTLPHLADGGAKTVG